MFNYVLMNEQNSLLIDPLANKENTKEMDFVTLPLFKGFELGSLLANSS